MPLTVVSTCLLLTACEVREIDREAEDRASEATQTDAPEQVSAAGVSASDFHTGERYYNQFCTTCHKVEVPAQPQPGSMLAPPAFAVAHHYRQVHTDPQQRIAAIQAYVKAPEEHPTLMPGAVRRFGKMPPMPLPDQYLGPISAYLALAEFEEPAWYRGHYIEEHGEANVD